MEKSNPSDTRTSYHFVTSHQLAAVPLAVQPLEGSASQAPNTREYVNVL